MSPVYNSTTAGVLEEDLQRSSDLLGILNMSPVDNSITTSVLEEDLQRSSDGKYTHTPVLSLL